MSDPDVTTIPISSEPYLQQDELSDLLVPPINHNQPRARQKSIFAKLAGKRPSLESNLSARLLVPVSESDHSNENSLLPIGNADHKRSVTSNDEMFRSEEARRKSTAGSGVIQAINEAFNRNRSYTSQSVLPSSRRKRSSTISAAYSTSSVGTSNTKLTAHVFQNMSIFKQDPNGGKMDQITVITNDPLEDVPAITLASAPPVPDIPAKHLKSYTTNIKLDNNSLADLSLGRRQRIYTEDDIGRRPDHEHAVNHKRVQSITTLANGKQRNLLDNKRSSSKRWLSLRNVIAFVNIIILTLAIAIISLVAYYAGRNSTQNAVSNMSNIIISDISLKMDQVLGNAETFNIFSESVFTKSLYPLFHSIRAMDHLYFFMTQIGDTFDQVYVVGPDSIYAGVGVLRDGSGNQLAGKFAIKYLNRTTRPFRLTYSVDDKCAQYDQQECLAPAFSGLSQPVQNITYSVWSRPFFRQARDKARNGWSSIYSYVDSRTLGMTAVRPVYNNTQLKFVCAVDITLDQLSLYLKTISQNGADKTLLFIVEPTTGLLVATSLSDEYPIIDSNGLRLNASLSGNTVIKSTTEKLLQSYGTLADINWPIDQKPIVIDLDSGHIIVGRYSRAEDDIDWILIAHVPFDSFNGVLTNAFVYQVPVTAIIVLCCSTICSIIITRIIGKPLKQIAEQMLLIADLTFEPEQPFELVQKSNLASSKDSFSMKLKEIDYLTSAMSSMKSGLISFSKYVPLDIVTLLVKMRKEAVLGVDEVDLTIFFSDIVNFTAIAECLPPNQLVLIMGEYLSEMSNLILQNFGVVDKYIGDSIMAFWNAPLSVEDHATVACTVALKCQAKLAELRSAWCAKGYPEIHTRIGLNTGKALAGNLGSTTRLNYTCLGDNVNLASRLESLNKRYGTAILISEFTWSKCNQEIFIARSVDIVVVKGKTKPVRVYELVAFKRLLSQELIFAYSLYERAFDEYLKGNFWAAIEALQKYQALRPGYDDLIAKRQLAKCQELASNYIQLSDWSPVVQIDEK